MTQLIESVSIYYFYVARVGSVNHSKSFNVPSLCFKFCNVNNKTRQKYYTFLVLAVFTLYYVTFET